MWSKLPEQPTMWDLSKILLKSMQTISIILPLSIILVTSSIELVSYLSRTKPCWLLLNSPCLSKFRWIFCPRIPYSNFLTTDIKLTSLEFCGLSFRNKGTTLAIQQSTVTSMAIVDTNISTRVPEISSPGSHKELGYTWSGCEIYSSLWILRLPPQSFVM